MKFILYLLSLNVLLLTACKGTQVEPHPVDPRTKPRIEAYLPIPIHNLKFNTSLEALQKQRPKLYPVSTQTPNTKEFKEDLETTEIKSVQYYLKKAAETDYQLKKVVILYNTEIDPKEEAKKIFGDPNDNKNTSWYKKYDSPKVELKAVTYRQKLEIRLNGTNSSNLEEK